MQEGSPSRTALAAALYRAAHQVFDQGRIFTDPLAVSILGMDAEAIKALAEEHPWGRRIRIFIAARTRVAEDALAEAVHNGVCQLVILGAGLDTYAYRGVLRDRLQIFEVDHPDTQAWKRQRLHDASIAVPDSLTFAPIDFERQTLADGLADAGFDSSQPTFFTWLGVVPYLTEEAIWSTLRFIAGLRAQVVFDYANPPATMSEDTRTDHDVRAARVAAIGEAWVSYFDTGELHAKLTALGFSNIDDLNPRQIGDRYFPGRAINLPEQGGHILYASSRQV